MKQILAITLNNLSSLPHRWGVSIVIIIGVAGVVAVLTSVLAMSTGLRSAGLNTAQDGWAIVIRKGAFAETVSTITRDSLVAVESVPGIDLDESGELAFNPHYVTSISLPRTDEFVDSSSMIVRGLTPRGLALIDLEIIEGRMINPALRELVVGRLANSEFTGLDVGDEILHKGVDWQITGIFTARGSAYESELIGDITAVMSGMQSTSYSSTRVQLEPGLDVEEFSERLAADPRLKLEAKWESEYYENSTSSELISIVAYVVSGIMAVGAVFGALNVMYSAVSARTREIATLRALGFGRFPVIASVLVEAMCLALIGGALGVLVATILYQGSTFTSGNLTTISTIIQVTPEIATTGLVWGLVIGFIGGLTPAIGAARMNIVDGLRSDQ
ncbi:MAG: FtsX-like permease family protein [Pseudomonadales bacterium]|nr:FtsX-like permease family protein [Pseudomonadales bacterium]